MSRPPLSLANSALADARRQRAEWLIAVAEGTVPLDDFIRHAATEEGRPLLRVKLRQLLMAQPGWGEVKTRALIDHVLAITGAAGMSHTKVTLAWLLDSRAGGKRFLAFLDAITPKAAPPHPGFPFAASPSGGAR